MMRTTTLMAGLLLPIAGGCTQPSDLYQRAIVTIVDGQVCVAVTSDGNNPSNSTRLAGLTLSRLSGDRTEAVWELDFTAAPRSFVISPQECLRPGEPHGEGVTEVLLAKPVPGERYMLSIMGAVLTDEPDDDGWVTRLYRENFCLKQNVLSETSIVSVPWGAGRPRWEVCTE